MRPNDDVKTAACDCGPWLCTWKTFLTFDWNDFSCCIFKNRPFFQADSDKAQPRHQKKFANFLLALNNLFNVSSQSGLFVATELDSFHSVVFKLAVEFR